MSTSDFSRALDLLKKGQPDEALRVLDRIIEDWPLYAAPHLARAIALEKLNRLEEALASWGGASLLVPDSPTVKEGVRRVSEQLASPELAEGATDRDVRGVSEPPAERSAPPEELPPVAVSEGLHRPPTESTAPEQGGAEPEVIGAPSSGEEMPAWEDADEEKGSTVAAPESVTAPESSSAAEMAGGAGQDRAVVETDLEEVELERLIGELKSAQIIPRPDPDEVPPPDLEDDIDDVVSETLARIYATQRQFGEAARVYDRLALQNPDRSGEFEGKAAEMRRLMEN